MKPTKKTKINTVKLEKCILCGALTDIRIEKNIDERYMYINSAGQLCRQCYVLVYGEENRKK